MKFKEEVTHDDAVGAGSDRHCGGWAGRLPDIFPTAAGNTTAKSLNRPAGRGKKLAQRKAEADTTASHRAITANTTESLDAYLKDFPSGQYVEQILRALGLPPELVYRNGSIYSEKSNAEMVWIPAGEFQMGDNGGDDDERPVHTVYLSAFYMDKYEVTNTQFKQFIDAKPRWRKDRIRTEYHDGEYLLAWNGNTYWSGKAGHPVVYVSWYAAMAYAQWSGKRLPTEAEWEKAARGGLVGVTYPWGNTIDRTKANYDYHVGDTTPVGRYPANGYGLYDMVGNV
ncbi:MAG: SUMF1/EgtB/PvdO family nonheme iron enzyme, partial [Candidatus Poribacteria bacterium]|nr:SUMF1/EgtB/PvdO family nonheme iron enzyme [Candidatus Poribacteria bacterium]